MAQLVERQPRKHFLHKTDVDSNGFRVYVYKKYVHDYAKSIMAYIRKYAHLIDNPSMLDTFSNSKKNGVLKSLIAYSKYHGLYEGFRQRLKAYGVKWSRSSSIDAFFRIMGNSNSDILEWYGRAREVLGNSDLSLYLRLVLMSGLRKQEAINSFNILVGLERIADYYNEENEALEHFKYPKVFFTHTKNVFISMVPKDLAEEIGKCKPVTYEMIRLRLQRKGIKVRINELRDYYATFMVKHGLIKEEVDLLQGRVGKSIFVRHYWSPAIKELGQRVFNALGELEENLSP